MISPPAMVLDKTVKHVAELGGLPFGEESTVGCLEPLWTPVTRCVVQVCFLWSVVPNLSPRVTEADGVVRTTASGTTESGIAGAAKSRDFS